MSNRDSLGFGDLIPQDVVEIFAQEKHSKRGRKKRSHSLGRALGWLKGKKRKDLRANGQSLGLGPALDLALDGHPAGHQGGHKGGHKSGKQGHPQGNSHAVPKRNDDDKTPAPPSLQENVFIEASRPKYLEDLHTEALEGLKMMQQEETNNGVVYQDNESTISTITVQTDGNGEGFMTDSTIPDTSSVVSVQSSVSTRSSRSGLTRQGSTFRPLNSGRKSEKAKTRRRHRKTVGGIPHHVQRELGLDRAGWTMSSKLEEEQLFNGETDDSTTTDGPQMATESQKGASASLQDMKVIQPLRKHQDEQLCATHAGHRDDLALLHRFGPDLSGGQRPRSLAVPWMTTANSLQQEPPSPVMSMSPQAAYMSKIIPNAVLPPSIEVVEISRGRSRSSLRTVSKTSLLLSSPAPSRASSRASSSRTTSSRASNITSASRYNASHLSDSSCWSNSESSETLVSDSSTISSSSTPRQKRSQDGDASAKEDKVSIHSSISKASKCTSNGKLISKGDKTKNQGPFVRSYSVMKPKRAPPPPNRSYSLYNKMKRRSRDLAEVRIISGESSPRNISASGEENEKNKPGSSPVSLRIIDSPDYNADTSSLDDSTGSFSPFKSQLQALKTEGAAKVEESKDATKEKQEPLQENKLSKMISPSSGYSSQDGTSPQLSKQTHSSSPRHKRGILAKLQRLFPGSTPAGSAPSPLTQPEAPENTKSTDDPSVDTTSASPSVRALRELFNIPPPPKVHAPPPPPPEVWAHNKRTFELLLGPPAPDNTYTIIKKNPKDRRQQRQSPSASAAGSVKSLGGERKQKNGTITVENMNGSPHVLETKKVQESGPLNAEIHKENNERLVEQNDLKGSSKVTEKDETVRVSEILSGMLVKAVEKREERMAVMKEEDVKKTSTQATEVKTNMDTLPAISLVRISPTPSPLVHHPSRPPTQQTTEVASDTVQAVVSPEFSWPPPPPAMDQVGLSGHDDIDFPIPPPPLFCEERLVIPVQVPPERSIPGTANIEQVNSSCKTRSVVSVVKTEGVKVTTEAETLKTSSSRDIPPPPPYTAPPPPVKAVSPPTTKEVILPPPQEFSPPPPKEVSPLPPKEVSPPPPPKEVSPVMPEESSPPLVQVLPPPVTGVSPTLVNVVSPPLVKEVSPPPVIECSVLPAEEVAPPSCQENAPQSSEEAAPVSKLCPPQTISPPPPIEPVPPLQSQPQSTEQEIDVPLDSIPSKSETNPVSCTSILTPPQSIPPPPPLEFLSPSQVAPSNTDGLETQEASPSLPHEASIPPALETTPSPEANIPLPPPLPVQGLASIEHQPSPASTENQSPEPPSAPAVQEEPTPIVTPSLLQMVKLRSVNSSPEPPKAQEPAQAEVSMRTQQPSNQVPCPSASGEAPQKPIRRSLIMTSPTSTSPPVIITSEPALSKSQSAVVSSASSTTVLSPMKKSPPAMTTSPSMNLQEAIRLRTAARSKDIPASRLSLHSPTSPVGPQKSPSSTASFIFSKSNNKVAIETKPTVETTETSEKNLDVSSVTKGVKMPPPIAKKPKTKAKETETSEGTEQTAGQEAQPESIRDTSEKTNRTAAGTGEGGDT
ncbi:NHS-like protein 3 [Thunnus thynnus]|uniref:NHS-like protein 3 n=1 Tax=Thunnus thynnus TaxID=8237 RepID=UPI0035283332